MLARPLHGGIACQRPTAGVPPAGAGAAARFLLARRFHAGSGRNHSRLPGGAAMSRVIVTDYTFPDLAQEQAAAGWANLSHISARPPRMWRWPLRGPMWRWCNSRPLGQ